MLVFAIILLRGIYVACVLLMALYTCGQLYLLYTYVRHANSKKAALPHPFGSALADNLLPRVTVQLPLYNERYVARRIVDAAAALDYPRDRLHIQVLDDSTDDTTEMLQGRIAQLQSEGLCIDLVRRPRRIGYKAGALAYGLERTEGEFIAIFDADFVPQPDFLQKTIPYFLANERVGVVQTRWGHLNAEDNLLTQGQALAIDSHFAVEQFARSHGNMIFSFNGTCGLWRRACIEDAGGWQTDTLTEDFDLSYRAQINGWRFVFVRDVVVPGEVPPQMQAYKQQQARWAKGSTQVLIKLSGALLHANLSWRLKFMGMLQLCQYAIQPVMLLTVLLTPLMILTKSMDDMSIAPIGIMGLGGPLLSFLGQQALYRDWAHRCLRFPLLMVFSSGMAFNNSRAVLSALMGQAGEFKRTPKFRLEGRSTHWQRSQYVAVGTDVLGEMVLCTYTLLRAALSDAVAPGFMFYFLLYTLAFYTVAGLVIF